LLGQGSHVLNQHAIVTGHEVQVLVAADQIAERSCLQEHLKNVRAATLIDVPEALLKLGAAHGIQIAGA
jgi:hypothetical protein